MFFAVTTVIGKISDFLVLYCCDGGRHAHRAELHISLRVITAKRQLQHIIERTIAVRENDEI